MSPQSCGLTRILLSEVQVQSWATGFARDIGQPGFRVGYSSRSFSSSADLLEVETYTLICV